MEPALEFARKLRRESTDAEILLWSHLRNRRLDGYKFRRQYRVDPYILDFFCVEHRLAIEVDGSQHLTEEGEAKDARRTAFLLEQGIRVLRFSNLDVLLELMPTLETIFEALQQTLPLTLTLSPEDGGEGTRGDVASRNGDTLETNSQPAKVVTGTGEFHV